MKIGKFKATYLNAADIKEPQLVTIRDVSEEKVGTDGKLVMYTDEIETGIALNKTCLNQLEELLGSDDTDDWIGEQVVIFNDHSVMFQGKKVGGVRFRGPKNGAVKPASAKAAKRQAEADDSPF